MVQPDTRASQEYAPESKEQVSPEQRGEQVLERRNYVQDKGDYKKIGICLPFKSALVK
jgi:hypothetical protein